MRTDLAEQPAHSLLALNSSHPSHPSTRYLPSTRPSRAIRALVTYPRAVPSEPPEHLPQGIGSLLLSNQIIYPMATNRSPAETARSFLDV